MHCKLTRQLAQEDNNIEDEKINAIKTLLTKNGSLQSMDKEIEVLLSDKNTNALRDNLGVLWDSQARLQEKLSKFSDYATEQQQRLVSDINNVCSDLKKYLYDSLNIIEEQKKKLIVVHELLRKKLKFAEGTKSFKDLSFKLALEELLDDKSNMVPTNQVIIEENDEDSDYHSFMENPETLKHVQSSFFQKNFASLKEGSKETNLDGVVEEVKSCDHSELQCKSEQIKDEKETKNKILHKKNDKLQTQQQDFKRKKSGSAHNPVLVSFSLDKVKFPSIRNLITTNPAFTKYEIPDGPLVRDRMPVYRDPNMSLNVWSLFKDNIGKDLSKITMPVYLNEPQSMIQKIAEYLTYSECFRAANACNDRYMRPAYVLAGFFMYYAHTINRLKKPFNSLLGETYELIDGDIKLIAEQISHHPPVSAYYVECNDFIFEGFFHMNIKFSYKGFQATPNGDMIITLKKTKEKFSCIRPVSTLHNYIVGKMYLWHSGDMIVRNETTGDKAIIYFKPKGWTSKNDYEADGKVVDEKGQTHYHLYGKWDSFISAIDIKTQNEIKLISKRPDMPEFELQYYYSKFAVGLNHLIKGMVLKLPMTDTRFRSDQRAYEYGDLKLAADEKHRLEEAQRARRKDNEKKKAEHKPLWFDITIEDGKITKTKYKGGYWEAKESGKWPESMINIVD